MKVLLISANTLPASPAGPAYIAGAAIRAGHTVEVFECLFATDLAAELKAHIHRFRPGCDRYLDPAGAWLRDR